MPDPQTSRDLPADNDAMPKGDALVRAEAELDAVEPGSTAQPHFAPDTDPAQSIDEPVHDMLGRRDGP